MPVAITEPVPLYLTEAAGLVNKTPTEFSAAIEEGTDVPPTVLADTLGAVHRQEGRRPGVQRTDVLAGDRAGAGRRRKDNSIAVVGVTETCPQGKDYLSWMDANITALAGALGRLTCPVTRGCDRERTAAPCRASQMPAVRTRDAGLAIGDRVLWEGLDLDIAPGQFVAILGSNGSGQDQPAQGAARRAAADPGARPGSAASRSDAAARPSGTSRRRSRSTRAPCSRRGTWSGWDWTGTAGGSRSAPAAPGGRSGPASTSCWPRSVRPASATRRCPCCPAASCNGSGWPPRWRPNPSILLCDEPLAALDLRHQQEVAALLDRRRREHGTAVLFVTHDINAVLDYVDQVLYLAAGQFRLGPPAEVLTSAGLTELYGAPVDVLHAQGRVIVVASNDPEHRAPPVRGRQLRRATIGSRTSGPRREQRDRGAGRSGRVSIWDRMFNFDNYGELLRCCRTRSSPGRCSG